MLPQDEIDNIKHSVEVAGFMQSCGIELKKNGKGYKGYCPFHEDNKTPSLSVTPDKNLWQCFGCGKGGDIIEFVRLFDQVDFPAAVAKLKNHLGSCTTIKNSKKAVKKKTEPEKNPEKPLTPAHIKVLSRVIDFYHTTFCEDSRGREYLETRGIKNTKIFSDHRIGLSFGTLLLKSCS